MSARRATAIVLAAGLVGAVAAIGGAVLVAELARRLDGVLADPVARWHR